MKHLWFTLTIAVFAAIMVSACATVPESGDSDYGSGYPSGGHQH